MTRILDYWMVVPAGLAGLLVARAVGASGNPPRTRNSTQSQAAFHKMAGVLTSPRCINCNVVGNRPRQGDDMHFHSLHVVRGNNGDGLPAFRCQHCHGEVNSTLPGGPPGAVGWEMPKAEMPMAWEGLSEGQLCRSLLNPALNGHRRPADLIAHMKTPLVVWAWNPGGVRSKPPLSYDQFMSSVREWVATGASCPN